MGGQTRHYSIKNTNYFHTCNNDFRSGSQNCDKKVCLVFTYYRVRKWLEVGVHPHIKAATSRLAKVILKMYVTYSDGNELIVSVAVHQNQLDRWPHICRLESIKQFLKLTQKTIIPFTCVNVMSSCMSLSLAVSN